ncbi:MAG: MarC family protein [Pseudomonadota bacterium]
MDGFAALKFFGALFAIMNPLTNLPVFLSVTDGLDRSAQRTVAIKVVLYCALLGTIFALAGNAILSAFGISVDDFRVAGGLVLLLIGLNMLNGSDSPAHHGSEHEKAHFQASTLAFYPLAFPILVGPGTITTLILYRQQAKGPEDLTAYFAVFAVVLALIAVTFWFSAAIGTFLSQTGRVIMRRLMGMLLIAIAVDMLVSGLKALLPGLA